MTPTCKLFIEKYIDQINNLDPESCFTIFSELYLLGQDTYEEVLEICFSADVDLLIGTHEARKTVIVKATSAIIRRLLMTKRNKNTRINLTHLKGMLICTLSLTDEDLKDCFQQAGRLSGLI